MQLQVFVVPVMGGESVCAVFDIFPEVYQGEFSMGKDPTEILYYIIARCRAFYFFGFIFIIIFCRDLFPDGVGDEFAVHTVRKQIDIPAWSGVAVTPFRGAVENDLAVVIVIVAERFCGIDKNE